jgi:hypothetical protein
VCTCQLYWGVRLEAFVAVKSTEEDCLKIIYVDVLYRKMDQLRTGFCPRIRTLHQYGPPRTSA